MKTRHPAISLIALLVSALLITPMDLAAQQAPSAGKITTVLPIVNVIRGQQQIPAAVNAQVFWGDTINTGHLARARVSLDDGSILSVGSDSNLLIGKHDPAAQQTELDLNYGRVRAKAAAKKKRDVFVYFDNDVKTRAPYDAMRLAHLLGLGPEPPQHRHDPRDRREAR